MMKSEVKTAKEEKEEKQGTMTWQNVIMPQTSVCVMIRDAKKLSFPSEKTKYFRLYDGITSYCAA